MPFSSRPIKTAAAAQKPDALSQRRRDIFLKQVRERREDRRWDARGEDVRRAPPPSSKFMIDHQQIMRLDFVRRQRRWEAEQALAAPPQLSDPPEEEDDDEAELPVYSSQMQPFASSSQAPQPDEEVDAVLQQEDEELDALVALMESEDGKQEVPTEGFGSDDEDYDSIFREFVREDAGSDLQQQQQQGDEMDMS